MKPLLLATVIVTAAVSLSVAADDTNLWVLLQKGDELDRRRQARSALRVFHEAEKVQPNRVEVMLRISKEYSDLVEDAGSPADAAKNGRIALDYALRSVKLAPENAKAHLSVAVCYGRLTQYAGNREKLEYSKIIKESAERALALDPTEDFALHVLGCWNYKIANLSPILKALAKVIYGGLPAASNESAAKYFREAVRIAPTRLVHRSELARTYAAMGQAELARAEWESLLKLPALDPADEQQKRSAREALARL